MTQPERLQRLAWRTLQLGDSEPGRRFEGRADYLCALEATLDKTEAAAVQLCRELALKPLEPPTLRTPTPEAGRIHLEFGGGQFEMERFWAERARAELQRAGFRVSVSRRYEEAGSLLENAAADLAAAAASELVVTLADGPDVDGETAALQGYARALGRNILLYTSGRRRIYTGPEYDHYQNLMLHYSADRMVRRIEALAPAVRALLD